MKTKGMSRSENMRRIRGKNTRPEVSVRKTLRELGFTGYRLHRKDLPGKPDIAFIGKRKVIFVHGCFWHGHNCKKGRREPKSNREYWLPKIERTRQRDAMHILDLKHMGWNVLSVWECELAMPDELFKKLRAFMSVDRD